MNNNFRKLFKNFIIFFIGSFGSKFMMIVMVPFYTTFLSKAEYGSIDIISSTVELLIPIISVGLLEGIFRFSMSKSKNKDSVVMVCFSTVSFFILVTILTSVVINSFIKWSYMVLFVFLLCSTLLFQLTMNYLKSQDKSVSYSMFGIVQTFIALVLNLIFIKELSLSINGYIFAYSISYLVPSIIIFIYGRMYESIKFKNFDFQLLKEMVIFSLPLIFNSLSWWIINSSDKYMIRLYLGVEANGIYAVASKVPLILQTILNIFYTVWQISTNEIFESNKNDLKYYYEKFLKLFREYAFICSSIAILFSQLVMIIIAKNDFYEGWIYTPTLLLAVSAGSLGGVVSALYSAYKSTVGLLISTMIGGMANIIINIILIPYIGIYACAISTLISNLLISLYRIEDSRKFLDFDRGNKKMFICFSVLFVQAFAMGFIDDYRYFIQIVLLIIIIFLNKGVLRETFMFFKSKKK